MAGTSRNTYGHRAYRRQSQALRNRVTRDQLPCAWCGQPINTTLSPKDPMSFTADHPEPVAKGGRLAGQQLQPMHRRCNSQKNDSKPIEIWRAT